MILRNRSGITSRVRDLTTREPKHLVPTLPRGNAVVPLRGALNVNPGSYSRPVPEEVRGWLNPDERGGIRAVPADYFPNYHATLLRRAAPASFSGKTQLFRVITANIAVDLNQRDAWLHFDNSSFSAGVEHVEALWARIEAGAEIMPNFGRLTHTVQDFYSHSNWVELHQHMSPLPVWDMSIASLPAGALSGTYSRRARPPSRTVPTHAELNKDSPFAWVSPTGARVVADGPNRGKRFSRWAMTRPWPPRGCNSNG